MVFKSCGREKNKNIAILQIRVRKYWLAGFLSLSLLVGGNEVYQIGNSFSQSYKVEIMSGRLDRCLEEKSEDDCHGRWKEWYYADLEAGKALDRFYAKSLTGKFLESFGES